MANFDGPIGCHGSSCDDQGFGGSKPPLIYYLTLPLEMASVPCFFLWKIFTFPVNFFTYFTYIEYSSDNPLINLFYPFDIYFWLIYIPYFYILSCVMNYLFAHKTKP